MAIDLLMNLQDYLDNDAEQCQSVFDDRFVQPVEFDVNTIKALKNWRDFDSQYTIKVFELNEGFSQTLQQIASVDSQYPRHSCYQVEALSCEIDRGGNGSDRSNHHRYHLQLIFT